MPLLKVPVVSAPYISDSLIVEARSLSRIYILSRTGQAARQRFEANADPWLPGRGRCGDRTVLPRPLGTAYGRWTRCS